MIERKAERKVMKISFCELSIESIDNKTCREYNYDTGKPPVIFRKSAGL